MGEKKPFTIKCYSKKEMADHYNVSAKTFRKWLTATKKRHPEVFPDKDHDHTHLLTPAQVGKFVEHHGEP